MAQFQLLQPYSNAFFRLLVHDTYTRGERSASPAAFRMAPWQITETRMMLERAKDCGAEALESPGHAAAQKSFDDNVKCHVHELIRLAGEANTPEAVTLRALAQLMLQLYDTSTDADAVDAAVLNALAAVNSFPARYEDLTTCSC